MVDQNVHSLNERSLITPTANTEDSTTEHDLTPTEDHYKNFVPFVDRGQPSDERTQSNSIKAMSNRVQRQHASSSDTDWCDAQRFPREARDRMSMGMKAYSKSLLNHSVIILLLLLLCMAHIVVIGYQLYLTMHVKNRHAMPRHPWRTLEAFLLCSHCIFTLETMIRTRILGVWFLVYGRTSVFNSLEVTCVPITLILEIVHAHTALKHGVSLGVLILRILVICGFLPIVLRRRLSLLKSNLRSLVSADRRRYLEMGYDLDITYILPNVIAMSWPSTSIEAFYRNNITSVAEFLRLHHPNHYMVFNLCGEREYDAAYFEGNVQRFYMEDHCPVDLEVVVQFCTSVHSFLSQGAHQTVAVHCKGGKGRTGMMISCYLLYCDEVANSKAALEMFGDSRTADGARSFQGVESPSQARFVRYFERFLREPMSTAPRRRKVRIRRIRVGPLPYGATFPSLLWFALLENQTQQYLQQKSSSHHRASSSAVNVSSSYWDAGAAMVRSSAGLKMTSRPHNAMVYTRDPFDGAKRDKHAIPAHQRSHLLRHLAKDGLLYTVQQATPSGGTAGASTVTGSDFYHTEEHASILEKRSTASEHEHPQKTRFSVPTFSTSDASQVSSSGTTPPCDGAASSWVPPVEANPTTRGGGTNTGTPPTGPPSGELYVEYDLDAIVAAHCKEVEGEDSNSHLKRIVPFSNEVSSTTRIAFFFDTTTPLTSESIFQVWFHPAYEDGIEPLVDGKSDACGLMHLTRKDIDGPHKPSKKGTRQNVRTAIATCAGGHATALVFSNDFHIQVELEYLDPVQQGGE